VLEQALETNFVNIAICNVGAACGATTNAPADTAARTCSQAVANWLALTSGRKEQLEG
jgi:hypothetical protein